MTLLYLVSQIARSTLVTVLAEATVGIRLEEPEPEPEDPLHMELFEDRYLLEPADPGIGPDDPIDPDTPMQATPAGRALVPVDDVFTQWVDRGSGGKLELGPESASEIWALLVGWSTTLTHALAVEPLTAAEASEAIPTLSLGAAEDSLETMEEAGMLEAVVDAGETRYAPTEWLRRGIAPLAAAARQELQYPPGDTAPIDAADVEAAFRLVLPLLQMPPSADGICALAVDLDGEDGESPAGVTAAFAVGRLVAVEPGFDQEADCRAAASAADWLETLIDGRPNIELSGEKNLARSVVFKLHSTLFGTASAR